MCVDTYANTILIFAHYMETIVVLFLKLLHFETHFQTFTFSGSQNAVAM